MLVATKFVCSTAPSGFSPAILVRATSRCVYAAAAVGLLMGWVEMSFIGCVLKWSVFG